MRILLIEDEQDIVRFVRKGLSSEHFIVDWAESGEIGLNLAYTNKYDLAILDIKLPGIDGLEVCRRFCVQEKIFPIIMLSVKSGTDDKVQALNIGADDYLTKPFSFDELLARIRAVLRREKKVCGNKLHLADLELDVVAHTVKRGGKTVLLSKKEFTLLEYMLRNSGATLSRSMILEHVWETDTDPFTNTVDVHIRYLRKKVDRPNRRKLIHTVHGYGYKLG
jgi:DNA-binding response OmpR family regulator